MWLNEARRPTALSITRQGRRKRLQHRPTGELAITHINTALTYLR